MRRAKSETVYGRVGLGSVLGFTSPDGNGGLSTPKSRSDAEGSSDECHGLSRRSPNSVLLSCSSSGMTDAALVPYKEPEVNENGLESSSMPQAKQNFHLSSPSVLVCAKVSFII